MTDLEEEILFRLTACDFQGSLELVDQVSVGISKFIPLAEFHEAMIMLEKKGWVQSVKADSRKNYSITESGKAALQQEWDYYRSLYKV